MQLVFNPKDATASNFHDPLLLSIGKLTQFQPFVGVKGEEVIRDFLETYLSTEDHAHYSTENFSHRNVVTRRIGFAFRNQREEYCKQRTPMTVLVPDPDAMILPEVQEYYDFVDSIIEPLEEFMSENDILDFLQDVEDQIQEYMNQGKRRKTLWALTEAGALRAVALQLLVDQALEGFTEPVILALGENSKNQPYHYLSIDQIKRYVLEDLGENPTNFQFQLDDCVVQSCSELCEEKINAAYVLEKEGQWCLTLRGIAKYQQLSGIRTDGGVRKGYKSVTTLWLEEFGKATIKAICGAIAKSCPLSATMELVESHAYDYLNSIIARDAMFSQIICGKVIYPSTVAQWAVKYTYSQFRNWGTDAAMRSLRTALTETERKKLKPVVEHLSREEKAEMAKHPQEDPWNARTISPTFAAVSPTDHLLDQQTDRGVCFTGLGGLGDDGDGHRSIDFVGGDLRQDVENQMGIDETLSRIDQILREKFIDPDSYVQIWYQMYQDNPTPAEISRKLKSPLPEVKKKIRVIRSVLQQAVRHGKLDIDVVA